MFNKVFILLPVVLIFSCAAKPKKYTLVMVYKKHLYFHDDPKPVQNERQFIFKDDEEAYDYGTTDFALLSGNWNDTAFYDPVEPVSFKVIDQDNKDIRDLLSKEFVRKEDSIMAVMIKEKRLANYKVKQDFLKGHPPIKDGLSDLLDSIQRKKIIQKKRSVKS